jgi:uncharacterized membrane protein YkoI
MKGFMLLLALAPLSLCLLAAQVRADDEPDAEEAKIHENARTHLPKAKLTLAEAIPLALKSHPGGHAVEGGFEVDGDDYDFIIEISVGGKLYDVEVDAMTGKVESDNEVADASAEEKTAAQAVAKTKITLAKAITAAVQAIGKGARAFDAGPHLAEGKVVYEVGIVSGKDIHDVHVDGATGKVLAQKKAE